MRQFTTLKFHIFFTVTFKYPSLLVRCMNIAESALNELYPELDETREVILEYHGGFRGYNANIKWSNRKIEIRMSKEWKDVSELIQKGLIQHLLIKLYKRPKTTMAMELYERFLKNLSQIAKITHQDPILKGRYDLINKEYFDDLLDECNLVWGGNSFHKLGTYTYSDDTIMMSSIFKDSPVSLLDYVLYHEMIHKQMKFTSKNGRMRSHTAQFRKKEREFKLENAEEKLNDFIRKRRKGKGVLGWFLD